VKYTISTISTVRTKYTYQTTGTKYTLRGQQMIYAITNQKGGVGKSTTTHALGAGLFYKKFKVLFVDLDPQGNVSYAMNADIAKNLSSYNLLTTQEQIAEIIQRISIGDTNPIATQLTIIIN
jgi:chromosome partitioning protein